MSPKPPNIEDERDATGEPPLNRLEQIFPGPSALAVQMRAHDWARSVLGPPRAWPQSLRTLVSVILASPQPAIVYWGSEFALLYNDSARALLGSKHPDGLGVAFTVLFPEAWPVLGPLLQKVMSTGEAVHAENLPMQLARKGFLEDCFFTFAYIPALQEDGRVGGVFVNLTDTTAQVLAARRLEVVREVSLRVALCSTVAEVLRVSGEVLRHAAVDLPFFRLYETRGGETHLLVGSELEGGSRAAAAETWPLEQAAREAQPVVTSVLPAALTRRGQDPAGAVAERACVLSLPDPSADGSQLGLVVGLNPRIAFDEDQRGFLGLLARQIVTSIASMRALEEKTLRAAHLAALDRQKTQFFSNVSHELRTPLTLMLAPLEDVLTDTAEPVSPRQRERLALLQRGAQRLLRLVNQLLEFTRLEAGRARTRFVPVDLTHLTRELANHFESFARRAGLTFTVETAPLPEPVWVDRDAWERIVFNLLSNSFKFTLTGGVTLRLVPVGAEVELSVHDTGTGIPAQELPRMFERFHRVEGARGRSFEGSGIGLALVQELVKLHGGEVSVRSTLGEGSVFIVRLHRGRAHLPPEQLGPPELSEEAGGRLRELDEMDGWLGVEEGPQGAMATAALPGPAAPPHAGVPSAAPRVLVVDDNADLRSYLRGLLEPEYRVEIARDGAEALAALRTRQPPDLVLSDVMMPGLDGFELLRAIRADARLQALPVILLSARAGEESMLAGLDSGADDYLTKPFSARELRARARTQLTMSQLRAQLAVQAGRALALQEAVQARDDFLSVASHELKTPLAGLKLHVEMLERLLPAAVRGQVAERLGNVRRQAQRLGALVESLLDVSQVASGRMHLHRERTDVFLLVSESLAQMQDELERASCRVTLESRAALMANVDPVRVEQMVRALLSNAARFGESHPVEVQLTEDGRHLVLRVTDHGQGVKPEDRERIFERFERAVSARKFGGLGLGLWVSRQVVEAHGGTISVTETLGGGATFTVRLPQEVG